MPTLRTVDAGCDGPSEAYNFSARKVRLPLRKAGEEVNRSPMKRVRTKPRPGRLKGKDLEELRIACWHRDGGVCQECLVVTYPGLPVIADRSYHMAHVRNKRMWGDNLENVRVLCGKCHRAEHQHGKYLPKEM